MEQTMVNMLNQSQEIKDFDRVKHLIQKAQEGSLPSRDELIKANMKLVYTLVRRFKGKEKLEEDLFQVGIIGLMKSIKNFDLSRDLRFSTYAVPIILGEIRRFLRDDGLLKVSRVIKDHARIINHTKEQIWNQYQTEVSLPSLKDVTGLTEEQVRLALDYIKDPVSLSQELTPDMRVEDTIADHNDDYERWVFSSGLKQAFEVLTEKEKYIVSMRYFQEKTQNEIGQALGVSQAHISRIEKSALLKLKSAM